MLVESVSILAILICIAIIFMRSGHRVAALGVTPLLLVPAVHILARGLSFWMVKWLPRMPREVMIAFADIAAVAGTGLMIFLMAGKLKAPRARKLYVSLMSGYNIILTCTYVYQTLEPLFQR